jgi:hypothetical protein
MATAGIAKLSTHDCRTCARLCHTAGGELEPDPIFAGERLGRDDAISGLQTAAARCSERQNRPRAVASTSPLTAFLHPIVYAADNPLTPTISRTACIRTWSR